MLLLARFANFNEMPAAKLNTALFPLLILDNQYSEGQVPTLKAVCISFNFDLTRINPWVNAINDSFIRPNMSTAFFDDCIHGQKIAKIEKPLRDKNHTAQLP